ncbi:hypothetical protein [Cellulomonas aerilata]|uniref:Uncharacterized protein n=1 Tax=Cellulomonas aerilata TaxID=515326 RepID=A0A512DF94_9CELL|nr:hypothetical protein [Cellulomonas aerilata]GEO35147.1 hypothetical protein CAE01nite_28720 [Cellulomonas aerilata]
MIRWLPARGILAGTPEIAALAAFYAATSTDAKAGRLYGSQGLGQMGGAPAERRRHPRLRSEDEARRVRQVSEGLTTAPFPVG